jgi:hypothetical protein
LPRNGLLALDFTFTFDAFRRQFECPGEIHDERKNDEEQGKQRFHYPLRRAEGIQDEFRDLGHKPCQHNVADHNAEYVAASQFCE